MKKLLLSLTFIILLYTPFSFGACCAEYHTVAYYIGTEFYVDCYGTCNAPANASSYFGFATGISDPSNCAYYCEAECYDLLSGIGQSVPGCHDNSGGSAYGGCMGGGYTTGGKPAPKGGPEPKNIKSK